MTIEEDRQRIVELFENLDFETHASLAFMWEHTAELGELEARVEKLEPKVIKLLQVISTLSKDLPEFRAHCKNLIRLIHHIDPTEEWMQKIREHIEFINAEIQKLKETARSRLISSRTQTSSHVDKEKIDFLKRLITQIRHELDDLNQVMQPFGRLAREYWEHWKSGRSRDEKGIELRFNQAWRAVAQKAETTPLYLNLIRVDELRKIFGSIFGFIPANRSTLAEQLLLRGLVPLSEFIPEFDNELSHIPEEIRSAYKICLEGLWIIWTEIYVIMHGSSGQTLYQLKLSESAKSFITAKNQIYPQLEILERYFDKK
ncbi:hypothetical protein HYX00_04850 [Candidatus Woesearchaeota archaeon]|nr:hypothetical protein [Candidatus Woesearchaeota archaeon]